MVGGHSVLLLKGKWSRSGTGYWRFDAVQEGRSCGVMLSFRFGYNEVKNLAKRRLLISPKPRVELSYQWPHHMLMDDGRDAPPVVVANNDDLDLFVEMRSEVEELNLCVTVLDENEGRGSVDPAEEWADIALEALEMKKAKRISDSLCDHGLNCSDSSDSSDDDDSFWHEFAEQAEEQAKHDIAPSKTETTPSLWDMMNKGKSVACDSEGDADKEEADEGESNSQSICGTSSQAVLDGVHVDEEDFPAMFGMDTPPVVDNVAEDEVDYEGDGVFVGRIFRSKVDCKMKMAIHAINRKFHFRTGRSTRTTMELLCVNYNCQWSYRSCLSPYMLEALICLHQWLRNAIQAETQFPTIMQMMNELDYHESLGDPVASEK